jgi:hypothetical protein
MKLSKTFPGLCLLFMNLLNLKYSQDIYQSANFKNLLIYYDNY